MQATKETHLEHFRKALPANEKYDTVYLTSLIQSGNVGAEATEQCGVIESNLCRRVDCGKKNITCLERVLITFVTCP